MSQEALLQDEIVSLHRFFVRWYSGAATVEEYEAVIARFRSDFTYIFPGGRRSGRSDLIAMLTGSHGANPDFRIQVTAFSFQPLLSTDAVALWGVTYEEYQSGARSSATDNGRISSAVLEIRDGIARWVRLHECWLPDEQVSEHHHNFGPLVQFGLPADSHDLPDIRRALEEQVVLESASQGQGNTIRMRALCAQLFCAGQPGDALLIWRAKRASFDASCSIDAELMCGAGQEETLAHLEQQLGAEAAAARAYLHQAAPETDGYLAGLLAYYQ